MSHDDFDEHQKSIEAANRRRDANLRAIFGGDPECDDNWKPKIGDRVRFCNRPPTVQTRTPPSSIFWHGGMEIYFGVIGKVLRLDPSDNTVILEITENGKYKGQNVWAYPEWLTLVQEEI
ncbi:hypothetical protein C4565_00480 [Candidatus Parcubacteria bacterium]|nr:MAG: hypothetical protein C4565_00480 [Candidatus Parcubacteria bacterium]